MHQFHQYAIIGTGAIGGYYGAKLQQAGAEVHFLLHRDFEQVKQKGLTVTSPTGDFVLPQVKAHNSVQTMPPCSVVIVSLKTTQNGILPEILPQVLAPDGVVLVLQNGLDIETAIAQMVGNERVMGGPCFICSNKIGPGQIHHLDYGTITLGDYRPHYQPCGITPRMEAIAVDFKTAGIPIVLTSDLGLARWKKLVWNIPFNGLSVVLGANTAELVASPWDQELIRPLMAEVLAAAQSCDRLIPDSFIDTMLQNTAKMKPYVPSMKLDYDAHRPLELAAIFGNPLRCAQAQGCALPHISLLHQQLSFLNTQNQQRR